jgi:hypothetical protein
MTRAPLGSIVCRKNSGVCESEAASSMVFTMRQSIRASIIGIPSWMTSVRGRPPRVCPASNFSAWKPAQNAEPKGRLYAASCLAGPQLDTKIRAAIPVADGTPESSGPEALKLKDVTCVGFAADYDDLPYFRFGVGLGNPMHRHNYHLLLIPLGRRSTRHSRNDSSER